MPGFGENLKREREMRGVTLAEMSATTKISIRLLTALEHDHFAELPGGVFTRSFIRAYAQYLGLDEEHVLSEYKRVAQPATDNDLSRLTLARTFSEKSQRPRVLPWVIIAVLLGSGYAVYRYSRRTMEAPGSSSRNPTASTSAGSPETASAGTASSSAVQTSAHPADSTSAAINSQGQNGSSPNASNLVAGTTGEGAGAAAVNEKPVNEGTPAQGPVTGNAKGAEDVNGGAPVLGEGDMVLQVTTSEEAWVAVAADGKTLMQRLLPANSTRTFRAKNAFDVTTGNAQGTVLTFNGAAQKSLGREGEFKRIHLARSAPPNPPHQGP